ncbi:hypothetical protein ANN_28012 [Periplaneta americana]|uniref:Uncharacterized protein n=1 Tax=Periplaneta americana TaxID=6978 RepID=A0ABQ8RUL3_PERAM|nr:hypothetical protein ANN_28012 [Periplaneta americana]
MAVHLLKNPCETRLCLHPTASLREDKSQSCHGMKEKFHNLERESNLRLPVLRSGALPLSYRVRLTSKAWNYPFILATLLDEDEDYISNILFLCTFLDPRFGTIPFQETMLSKKNEEKELVGSLAEKKLPTEGCTEKNGEREESSRSKKSDDKRH